MTKKILTLQKLHSYHLNEFCSYWNSGPVSDGSEQKTNTTTVFNDPDYKQGHYKRYELSDGWTIYVHSYDEKVLLCDEHDIIRVRGNTDEIIGLLLNEVFKEKMLQSIPDKNYGLVLSGGGAKGAFEIGVWRWLERTGLIRRITGISGTSVGALNSVLFSCSTLAESEEIWRSIRQDDLTHLNKDALKRGAEIFLQTMAATTMGPIGASMLVKDLLSLSGGAVFTQDKLSEIVDRVLEKKVPSKRIVFSCLARQSIQIQTEPPVDIVLGNFHNADYYCLNFRNRKEINRIVLASAALPIIYDSVKINHFQYRDGGCRDNTPYMPLVKSGFKKLIVVHLHEREDKDPVIEMVRNSILYHVYPTIHAKQVVDTIRISEEMTDYWINNGEQAATAQLGPLFRDGELFLPEIMEKQSDKEKAMDKFDFENFDFEDAFGKVQNEVKKPNILICGATGVGKSTLIRDLFQLSESEGPEIGDRGRSRTTGIHAYSPEGSSITLYDSQGYNIGADEKKFMKDVLGVIGEKIKNSPEEMSEHIHEVWYCVAAANNRFFEADERMICEIRKKYNIPVMVILTKVDCVDEEGIGHLKDAILEKIPDIDIFTYASDEKTVGWPEDIRKQYVQKEEITEWALMHLDESLRSGFVPAIKKSLQIKRKYISGKIIPKYAGLAGATVVATSFISVPFTDSVPLMALQVKMSYEIIKSYGIQTESQKIVADIIGTSAVSILGRTLASSLVKVIPLAGNIINATVNTTVAASVTAVLGFAVAVVCEQYLAACVDNNGAQNLPFAQYLNSERLKEAVAYVNAHKNEFNIQEIIEFAASKNTMNPEA